MKETKFCASLSGLDVPIITVTSRVNYLHTLQEATNFVHGVPMEIDPREYKDAEREEKMPVHKYKKYIVVCARVHPGESNASYIM